MPRKEVQLGDGAVAFWEDNFLVLVEDQGGEQGTGIVLTPREVLALRMVLRERE